MPAHWTRPEDAPSEIDVDKDVDVLAPGPGGVDDGQEPVTFPPNPVFRTPHPGEALTEEELESDLDEQ